MSCWPGNTGVELYPGLQFLDKGGLNTVWLLTINGAGVSIELHYIYIPHSHNKLTSSPQARRGHMVFHVPIDRPSGCLGIKVHLVNEVAALRYIFTRMYRVFRFRRCMPLMAAAR